MLVTLNPNDELVILNLAEVPDFFKPYPAGLNAVKPTSRSILFTHDHFLFEIIEGGSTPDGDL